jgi:hypothetical protein
MKPQNQNQSLPVQQQKNMSGRAGTSGPLEMFTQDLVIDFASVATVTAPDQAIVVPGSLAGDTVLCSPQGVWTAGTTLPQGRCLVDGTVQFRIANPTAGAIDQVSQTCKIIILRPRP